MKTSRLHAASQELIKFKAGWPAEEGGYLIDMLWILVCYIVVVITFSAN